MLSYRTQLLISLVRLVSQNYPKISIQPTLSSEYYSSARYTIPTNGVYQTATYSTNTATTRSTSAPQAAITSGASLLTNTSSANPAPDSSSGLGSGAKAGIGVGIAAGALATAGLALFFWLRRRKTHTKRGATELASELSNYKDTKMQENGPAPMYSGFMGELPVDAKSTELDSQPDIKTMELDSQSPPQRKVKTYEMQG
ncbi:MAG: hypothetical protein Q9216_006463 [Gyalolechia sp. 2 TL-2023]